MPSTTHGIIPQFTLRFFKGREVIKHSALRVDHFLVPGKPVTTCFDVRVGKSFGTVRFSYRTPGSADSLITYDFKVWAFDPS
ncbi:MAG: hypothetical protein JSS82_16685 [Bacteroidetes bacterium]|nr:hypothetical protein [Bacteroidota bacterium]